MKGKGKRKRMKGKEKDLKEKGKEEKKKEKGKKEGRRKGKGRGREQSFQENDGKSSNLKLNFKKSQLEKKYIAFSLISQ